jgi:hypothetical protein
VGAVRGLFGKTLAEAPSGGRGRAVSTPLSDDQRRSVAICWKINLAIRELGFAKEAAEARPDRRHSYQLDQRSKELAAIRDAEMERGGLDGADLSDLARGVGLA